jgi:hypothetical protein
MASLRAQIMAAAQAKLQVVVELLDWTTLIRNPREPLGEDQLNAVILMDGGDREPAGLTGHVSESWLEFSVAMLVKESLSASAEDLLDAGFVAISNALLDPDDIQLGGLVIEIRRGAISDPSIGRAQQGARIMGGQAIDFTVHYLEREGDAELPGP